MLALFTVTIFVGSALLFLVQPMFARLALPLLGGAPAVWNTAMMFFQAALLGGYACAHASLQRLGPRRQTGLQLVLLLLPLAVLPVGIPEGWSPPGDVNPLGWLLALLLVAVGLPFFAVATMSPVLQRWFSATGHAHAADPYFLYAASNLGSILALLAYPFLIEPHLSLRQQTTAWSGGYALFLVLATACAAVVWKTTGGAASSSANAHTSAPSRAVAIPVSANTTGYDAAIQPSLRRRLRWVFLAFVPSSLLLGVTSYLSSEVAVVPLLWIGPLALYLLTFVLAFSRRGFAAGDVWARAFPILVVALVVALNTQATEPLGWLMLLHLAAFFVAALLCHRQLAADRPAPAQLTEFYLWISVGGALGGMFNALLAPLLFNSVAEYPLALVLACFAVANASRAAAGESRTTRHDFIWPLLLAALAALVLVAAQKTILKTNPAAAGIVLGAPALVCYFFSRRPVRFTLGVGALFAVGLLHEGGKGRPLYAERSFFGVHRVTFDAAGSYHLLVHGKTLHGIQSLDPARRTESLAYYHRTGPVGAVLDTYARDPAKKIGVVGLGAGSLASFAQRGQPWSFFEIDPVVAKLAGDHRFFTFLRDSPGEIRVVLGDARLSLHAIPDRSFDVLVLDAFSSDAIPVHLVTREALALYRQKLAPGGVLAFHISNLHLDLEPVLTALAHDARLACLLRDDTVLSAAEHAAGKAPSIWLMMAATPNDLAPLARDPRWRPGRSAAPSAVWTDDYSSLLRIFRWK